MQTIKFIDVDEMCGALKGYMEKGKCTIGEKEVVSDAGICAEWGDTRDTEAIKRIATGYLKLIFPYVRKPGDISSWDFKTYCLSPARRMREIIRYQLGLLDNEYRGKSVPDITVKDY